MKKNLPNEKISNFKKKMYVLVFSSFLIFVLAFVYRFQRNNSPFWVDEFSSANQALLFTKYGINFLFQNERYVEPRNILTHVFIALSFSIFGISEWAARFPSVIFGSLVPVCAFILCKLTYRSWSASINSAVLCTCSYFLITWSQQARSYSFQEFLTLSTIILYVLFSKNILDRFKIFFLILMGIFTLVGVLTNVTFIFVLSSILIHYIFSRNTKKSFGMKPTTIIEVVVFAFLFSAFFFKIGLAQQIVENFKPLLTSGLKNNLLYYHSFLWREYTLVSFLGFFGLFLAFIKKNSIFSIFFLIIFQNLLFFLFIFGPAVSRYLLTIFPLILIGMGIFIDQLAELIGEALPNPSKKIWAVIGSISITLFVVLNGDKFVLRPKHFYSVNHDFREIALVDYNKVYAHIKSKGDLNDGKTVVIDTWPDRLEWYLGQNVTPNVVFRWEDNGEMKKTPFHVNERGEKILNFRLQTQLISNLSDLEKLLALYPKGFIWIDDNTLPHDVIEYAENHLKKELYLDHYPLDDNPYSLWPATLYSWGV